VRPVAENFFNFIASPRIQKLLLKYGFEPVSAFEGAIASRRTAERTKQSTASQCENEKAHRVCESNGERERREKEWRKKVGERKEEREGEKW
jgi:hypothetical protein